VRVDSTRSWGIIAEWASAEFRLLSIYADDETIESTCTEDVIRVTITYVSRETPFCRSRQKAWIMAKRWYARCRGILGLFRACELTFCFLFADLEDYFKLEYLSILLWFLEADINDFKTPFESVERVINMRDGFWQRIYSTLFQPRFSSRSERKTSLKPLKWFVKVHNWTAKIDITDFAKETLKTENTSTWRI